MKPTDELLLAFHIIQFTRLSHFNFFTFCGKNTLEWLNFFQGIIYDTFSLEM